MSGFSPCTLTGHITHGTARLIARHGHGISTWTCCNMHEQLKLQLRRVQLVLQPIAAVLGRPLDDHLAPKRTRPVGERDDRTSCQRRGIDPRNGYHTPIAMQQPLRHVPSKKTHPAMQSTAVTVPITIVSLQPTKLQSASESATEASHGLGQVTRQPASPRTAPWKLVVDARWSRRGGRW